MKLSMPAPPRLSLNWSPQQAAAIDAVKTPGPSILVEAVAGSGKTTTLVAMCQHARGDIAFLAFNKKIADDIKARIVGFPNVRAGTFHSFGLAALNRLSKMEVNSDKMEEICEALDIPVRSRQFVKFLVGIAKQSGFRLPGAGISWNAIADHYDAWDMLQDPGKAEELLLMCERVLQISIDWTVNESMIDFDDMIYMPLLLDIIKPEFDFVFVDEAQDTNTCRRLMARKMLMPAGRVVAVGDRHQAIYGFTGADAESMTLIAEEFKCEYLPLTVTYRCPKAVVRHAQQWVSHIEAHADAPEGEVRTLDWRLFNKLGADAFGPESAVLCRMTRPLITLALDLIRRGIGCRVEGRDIGQGLLKLARKTMKTEIIMAHDLDRLDDYCEARCRVFEEKEQYSKAASLRDQVSSLHAVLDSLGQRRSMTELSRAIDRLFGDTTPGSKPTVLTLSTVHKAKGREWDRVYLYGRNAYMPWKYARQQWEFDQEYNLIYVAVTRAKKELIEVELEVAP